MSEPIRNYDGDEVRVLCTGNCYQQKDGQEHRCEAHSHHEWCQNYWVAKSHGIPEYFEEKKY